jgi:hypothetical protein
MNTVRLNNGLCVTRKEYLIFERAALCSAFYFFQHPLIAGDKIRVLVLAKVVL